MKTRKDFRLSADRDLPLLDFLWRWKVATTSALAVRFFPHVSMATAYNRISWLRRHGLIQYRSDTRSNKYVWMLSPKGYAIVKPALPPLQAEGYASENIAHDLIASAVQLADWLKATPAHAELYSEQELRRVRMDCYPDWVPQSALHRPDGYWRIKAGGYYRTIALEIETGHKSPIEYELVADRYANLKMVTRVLWMVKGHSLARTIHGHLLKGVNGRVNIHNMAVIGDFIQYGWRAPILAGPDEGKDIAFLLNCRPVERASPATSIPLLDTRKCPYKSKTSLLVELGDFGYRLGSNPIRSALSNEQDLQS